MARQARSTSALPTLDLRRPQQWRAWLRKHHSSRAAVWLVFHRDHTGVRSIPYEDSVREALCFGWVDSLVKRLDDHRYARKFTPRKPDSKWSASNRKRWRELKAAGRLAAAGMAASPSGKASSRPPVIPDLPAYLGAALRANAEAWSFFRTLAPTERRRFVAWIHFAKRPATREWRIRESIARLAAGMRLGLK